MKNIFRRAESCSDVFGSRSSQKQAKHTLKRMLLDRGKIQIFSPDQEEGDWKAASLTSSLSKLERLLKENPSAEFRYRDNIIFSTQGIVEFLKAPPVEPHYDLNVLESLKSFEELRNCYHNHLFDVMDANGLSSTLNRLKKMNSNMVERDEFLINVLNQMTSLYPWESLEYALKDPYALADVTYHDPFMLLPDLASERSASDEFKEETTGVILLAAKPRRLPAEKRVLSVRAFHAALSVCGQISSDGLLIALDASKIPLHLRSTLGGLFVPTNDFHSSVKLLFMVAGSHYEALGARGVIDKEIALVESVHSAIRSHQALA